MKDLKHYLILVVILLLGFALFWFFNYNRQVQKVVVLLMGGSYVAWGVVHHLFKKDLHWRILIEYIIVAILASTVVIFLLLQA